MSRRRRGGQLASGAARTRTQSLLCGVAAYALASGSASDVSRQPTTRAAAQRDLTARGRREVVRCAFDLARAGRTAERRPCSVTRDQVKCLRRIKRRRSRLAHMLLPRDNRLSRKPRRRSALWR